MGERALVTHDKIQHISLVGGKVDNLCKTEVFVTLLLSSLLKLPHNTNLAPEYFFSRGYYCGDEML